MLIWHRHGEGWLPRQVIAYRDAVAASLYQARLAVLATPIRLASRVDQYCTMLKIPARAIYILSPPVIITFVGALDALDGRDVLSQSRDSRRLH